MDLGRSDYPRRIFERSATLLVGALAATLGYAIHEARAEGVPTSPTMFYSGTLEEGGVAAEGTRQMKLRLFDGVASRATMLCESTPNEGGGTPGDVTVRSGRFRFAVSDACVDAVRAHPDVFAELVVGSDPLPRAKVGAVPYAIEAEHAKAATNADIATNAAHATSADTATNASTAAHATSADTATNATHATTADTATSATRAVGDFSVAGTLKVGWVVSRACTQVMPGNVSFECTDCTCPAGTIPISGGSLAANPGTGDRWLQGSSLSPSQTAWRVACAGPNGRVPCVGAEAYCMRVGN